MTQKNSFEQKLLNLKEIWKIKALIRKGIAH